MEWPPICHLKSFFSRVPSRHMGASGRIQLQLLVFGQAVTRFGLGISLYFQWENRVTLRELQWLGESTVHRSLEFGEEQKLNRVANSGGDPEDRGPPVGKRPNTPTREPEIHAVRVGQDGPAITTLILWLGWVLVALFGLGFFLQRKSRSEEVREETVGSPSERQRAVAQRQLAEVRLRKNGFA